MRWKMQTDIIFILQLKVLFASRHSPYKTVYRVRKNHALLGYVAVKEMDKQTGNKWVRLAHKTDYDALYSPMRVTINWSQPTPFSGGSDRYAGSNGDWWQVDSKRR